MPAIARPIEDEGGERGDREDDGDRHRHAEDAAGIGWPIERLDIGRAQRDRPALAQPRRQAAKDAHGAERDDEGLDLADGGDQAVCKPAERAGDHREDHRDRQHQHRIGDHAGIHQDDHQAGDERRHRADRQIEAARGDDEGGADRDDGDEGAARRNVGEIGDADEIGIEHCPDDQQQDQSGKGGDARRSTSRQDLRRISRVSSFTLIAKINLPSVLGILYLRVRGPPWPARDASCRRLPFHAGSVAHDFLFGDLVALELADDPPVRASRNARG